MAAGSFMAAISWRKWPDLIIDFGRQVYIPWQLAEGQVLYKDIHYIYGPFSAYLHALVFKIFGPGIIILAWFNIALIVCLTALIYDFFKKTCDDLTAVLTSLVFVTAFAFAQYVPVGNYNYVCAYAYEIPHGIFLSVLAFHQLYHYVQNQSNARLYLIGFLSGLIFLTKPEMFLAAFAALFTGLFLYFRSQNLSVSATLNKFYLFFIFLLIPPVLFTFYLTFHVPFGEAIQHVINPWMLVFHSSIKTAPLFEQIMGTDQIAFNIEWMAWGILLFLLTFFSIFIINHALKKTRWIYGCTFFIVLACLGGLIHFFHQIPWQGLLRPLPVLTLGLLLYLTYEFKQDGTDPKPIKNVLPLLAFTLFALILMFKMILNVHIHHYGFGLAMPGVMVLIACLIHIVPRRVKKFSGTAFLFRSVSLVLVLFFSGAMAYHSYNIYRLKIFPIGEGRDTIYDYSPLVSFQKKPVQRGMIFKYVLEYLEQEIDRDAEIVTLPEGILLNYLARRRHPIPDIEFSSGIWILLGESSMLNSLKQSRPPYIIFISRDFSSFGPRIFGKDYAQNTLAWILNHYTLEKQFGQDPLSGTGFGIQILKRSDHSKQVLDG